MVETVPTHRVGAYVPMRWQAAVNAVWHELLVLIMESETTGKSSALAGARLPSSPTDALVRCTQPLCAGVTISWRGLGYDVFTMLSRFDLSACVFERAMP